MRERERERCQGDPVNNIFTQRKQVRQKEERRSWPHGPSSCRFYAPVIWRGHYRRRNNTSDYLGSQLFYGLEILVLIKEGYTLFLVPVNLSFFH